MSIENQELLCKGWSHHLIHMTAVHLWQNWGAAVLMEHSRSPFFTLFLCIQFPRPGTSEWRSLGTLPPDSQTTVVQFDDNRCRS